MQRHDRLLPAPAHPRGVAPPLGLGLDPRGANALNPDAEDLLHRLADLGLVRAIVHAERVLVGREQRVALLRDDRLDDHRARVHAVARSGLRAMVERYSTAAGESTSRCAPMMSATPTW